MHDDAEEVPATPPSASQVKRQSTWAWLAPPSFSGHREDDGPLKKLGACWFEPNWVPWPAPTASARSNSTLPCSPALPCFFAALLFPESLGVRTTGSLRTY